MRISIVRIGESKTVAYAADELDEALTARGLDTKVVFLLYNELLWAPEQEKIKNPDRFVLMFAPITRSYKEAYCNSLGAGEAKTVPYERNFRLKLIPSVRAKVNGDKEGARAGYEACVEYLCSVDGEIGRGVDYCEYKNTILKENEGFGLLKV